MNDNFKKSFKIDKLGVETEVAYINSFGVVYWKHRQLMPIYQLELPKDLYLYINISDKDEE